MQKIKILDPQQAIKIAAGEVIERPSHIIKELIENSVDADATEITIHTKQAGKSLISITDNGSGMSPEDAKICYAHHSTSKIKTVNDLTSIATYGFRGEALSSISAVAKLTIKTKTVDDPVGTELVIKNGKVESEQNVSSQTGTTIKVENLFDEIPARKKFLKSNDTEWNSIISIFQAFCLRYSNIYFKLFYDGKLSYNCHPTKDIKQRCAQLWTNNIHDNLISISEKKKDSIIVHGAISKSNYHRYNRNQIFTFVNNRWVKNIEISRAIIKGYQNVLPPQKYPAAFLFIKIDPELIDVNIHPKKEEIKFLNPGRAQKFIKEIVTEALNQSITANHIPSKNYIENPEPKFNQFSSNPFTDQTINNSFHTNQKPHETIRSAPFNANPFTEDQYQKASQIKFNDQFPVIKNNNEKSIKNISFQTEPIFKIIGQFNSTYIMIEQNKELKFVDQHAAHERILYEDLKKNFETSATVQLLFPQIVNLSLDDVNLISKNSDIFKTHGIIFEKFSDNEIIIQATPVSLKGKAIEEVINTTLSWIKEEGFVDADEFRKKLHDRIHTQKACKMAFMAGDILNHEQMQEVIKKLLKIENRFCCPHGRPTMWNLPIKDIEKQFKRDYRSDQKNLSNNL